MIILIQSLFIYLFVCWLVGLFDMAKTGGANLSTCLTEDRYHAMPTHLVNSVGLCAQT